MENSFKTPELWLTCDNCGHRFLSPRGWRSHCYPCGGDDGLPDLAPAIFIALVLLYSLFKLLLV